METTPSNKRMQLTKLRAAPERQDKVPPCAPAGGMDGGTASQLIRGVRRTSRRAGGMAHKHWVPKGGRAMDGLLRRRGRIAIQSTVVLFFVAVGSGARASDWT